MPDAVQLAVVQNAAATPKTSLPDRETV